MENNDESFSPELVEEQIERFRDLLPSEDALLVYRLQHIYQSQRIANKRSLSFVWERVQQHQHAVHPLQEAYPQAGKQDMPMQMEFQRQRDKNTRKLSAKRSGIARLFGTIAAVLVIGLLIGSFALVFRNAAQKGQNATSSHRTPVTAPPSGLYISSQEDINTFQIERFDIQKHTTVWSQNVGRLPSFRVVGDRVYVSAEGMDDAKDGYVYALDAYTGRIDWRADLVSPPATSAMGLGSLTMPAATSNAVYVMAYDGTIYALDPANGHQLWHYTTGFTARVSGMTYAPGDVAVDGGMVYATIANHLFAVDAKSGKKVWSVQIDPIQVFKSPQVVDGAVYLASDTSSYGKSQAGVYSYDAKNGKQNWVRMMNNSVHASPTVVDNMVFFGSYDTNVYALRPKDGSEIWHYSAGGAVVPSLVVSHGMVYGLRSSNANVDTELFALDETKGTKLWGVQENMIPQGEQNGILYAGAIPSSVYAFNVSDGSEIWHQQYGPDSGIPGIVLVP